MDMDAFFFFAWVRVRGSSSELKATSGLLAKSRAINEHGALLCVQPHIRRLVVLQADRLPQTATIRNNTAIRQGLPTLWHAPCKVHAIHTVHLHSVRAASPSFVH